MRCGDEDAPVVLIELDAHDAPVRAGRHRTGLVAFGLALALQAIGGGRTAVLQRVAIGLETLKREYETSVIQNLARNVRRVFGYLGMSPNSAPRPYSSPSGV